MPMYDSHYYSISKEYHRAKYVVRAQVIRETWLGEDGQEKALEPPFQNGATRPWGFDPYVGAYYFVKVLQTYKGHPGAELQLFSENSTARFWLDVGSEYILFVTEASFEPPIAMKLTTDNCGNSTSMKEGLSALRQVEGLSRRRSSARAEPKLKVP